ncbi:hypothetical protein FISHEDRAFT_78047 [Fistulina hepatica ATCC 64428]|nr:hypothetical protein FISHEDRAFT_78047 [Fistulina hepatica ATCC 64428]
MPPLNVASSARHSQRITPRIRAGAGGIINGMSRLFKVNQQVYVNVHMRTRSWVAGVVIGLLEVIGQVEWYQVRYDGSDPNGVRVSHMDMQGLPPYGQSYNPPSQPYAQPTYGCC